MTDHAIRIFEVESPAHDNYMASLFSMNATPLTMTDTICHGRSLVFRFHVSFGGVDSRRGLTPGPYGSMDAVENYGGTLMLFSKAPRVVFQGTGHITSSFSFFYSTFTLQVSRHSRKSSLPVSRHFR
jgi:hypothetical protein